jgi:hypothetical protein
MLQMPSEDSQALIRSVGNASLDSQYGLMQCVRKCCASHPDLFALLVQFASADGTADANTLGWAARDSGHVLSPYKFTRRALGPKDVFIKITHAGMCHSDLHTINGDWGQAKYPVVPG